MKYSFSSIFIFICLVCLMRSFLITAFNLNSKECELANDINTKAIECFFRYAHYKNECGLGKRLLLDHYNIIYCNIKRIHKRSLTTTDLSAFRSRQAAITPHSIFELGHSAYTNPCSAINSGQTKCVSQNKGLIKCVSNKQNICIYLF